MSEGAALTPELARQLLDSDIANIVALVTAGQTLNKSQRALLEEYAKKRPATPAPAPAPAAQEQPPPAPESAPAPESFSLISDAPEPTLADFPAPGDYQQTQKVYAERYGVSLRTIKLWVADGKACDPPKPCPLDDPEAMLAWWHAVKHNRPPASLVAIAETARKERVGRGEPLRKPAEGTGTSSTTTPPTPPGPPSATPKPLSVGFAASLDRVRVAEAEANARYLDEFTKPPDLRDDSKTSRLRREWSELSEQLRFLEKAAPDVLAKSGEMLTREEVRRVLGELHGPIISGVRSLFRRVRLKSNAGASLDDLEKIYAAEVERLFSKLLASEFTPAAPE